MKAWNEVEWHPFESFISSYKLELSLNHKDSMYNRNNCATLLKLDHPQFVGFENVVELI